MTDQSPPTTRRELEAAIDELLREAHENGVEAGDHSYVVRDGDPATPDWEVLVVELAGD